MLGVRKYTPNYVSVCRARVEGDLSAYRKVAAKASGNGVLEAFEATFFNNMVLVLDHFFVHRLRTVEGKDGNALNEVRVLSDSLMENNGVMKPDKSIKLSSAGSVLGYETGEEIKLTDPDFVRLSEAFFAEIESRYV